MSHNIIPTTNNIEAFDDPEKLYHEINLLRIEGHYFCFDRYRKNLKNTKKYSTCEEIKTPEGVVEKQITIEPSKEYGRPSILAYKILQATIKKYSEYGVPFPEGVPFSQRELAKLSGRASFGGGNTEEFKKAIMQLRRTAVTCSLYNKETKNWVQADFNIFANALLSGKEKSLKACFFCLDPFFVKSLNNRYAFCLNYERMERLDPIGVIFFKRLFFYFSNIYSRAKRDDLVYTKDYADICKYWLGGLKILKYKSKILNEQLGKHLKTVKETGLIKKVEVVKNAMGDGFNLMFYPGKGFFEDYHKFYSDFIQYGLPFRQKHEERHIQQPMILVRYFYQKLFGEIEIEESILDASEVELASLLLKEYSFDDIKTWIEYSIQQAKKTGFEMKKFGGIKNYKTEFFIKREQERKKIDQQEKQDERVAKEKERQRMEEIYRNYRLEKVVEVKKSLSAEELKDIEDSVRMKETGKTSPSKPWFSTIVKYAVDSRLAKLAQVPSFEEWLEKQNNQAVAV